MKVKSGYLSGAASIPPPQISSARHETWFLNKVLESCHDDRVFSHRSQPAPE